MQNRILSLVISLLFAFLLGCSSTPAEAPAGDVPAAVPEASALPTAAPTEQPAVSDSPSPEAQPFSVSSAGIVSGVIGDAYGERAAQTSSGVPTRSLPLSFANVPEGTVCVALSMTDPDGGNWVHWLVANASPEGLAENASIENSATLLQGSNDFRFAGYGGSTPPSGTHTYVITAYALSEPLPLESEFSYKQFAAALEGRVLASAVLTGTYTH